MNGREVRLTNLDKLFWIDEKITKGGLIQYHADVAPRVSTQGRVTDWRLANGEWRVTDWRLAIRD